MSRSDDMIRESLMKQQIGVAMGAGYSDIQGGIQGSMAEPMPDVAQTERPWGPEHRSFDNQLRRLCTRARWSMSDRDVVSCMTQVVNELHSQLEVASKE